jgi:DNA polymerase III delta subunit
MIVFLYGKDSYRRKERKNFYASQFEKKYVLRAEPIDLADPDGMARFEESAKGRSLFEVKKLILLENAFEIEPKKLLPLLAIFIDSKDSGLLISEEKKPVKALGMLLKKPVVVEGLEELKGVEWNKFVNAEAKRLEVRIDTTALNFLADAYAGNSWGLITELEKFSSASRIVTKKDLEASGLEVGKNYFALVQTLRAPTGAQRLGALQILLSMNEPAAKVFNILAALWPQKTEQFAKYDQAIKFGRMDFEEALTDLVISA